MPSNVYLFDPNTASANSNDKPLIQIMREAELARSQESARIVRNAFKRIVGLFRVTKTVKTVSPKTVKAKAVDKPRLAA